MFDIIDFEEDRVRRAVNAYLYLCFKEYHHRIHQHWYHVMQDHEMEAAQQWPYDSITMNDWALICQHYKDPAYQVTHPNFFQSLMIESFILKFSLLPINLTANCTKTMYPECYKSGEIDRIALWGFEVIRSSYEVDGK